MNISVGSVDTCFKTVCVRVKIVRKFPASVRTLKAVRSVKNHYSRYRQFGNLQEVLHVFNNEGLDNSSPSSGTTTTTHNGDSCSNERASHLPKVVFR